MIIKWPKILNDFGSISQILGVNNEIGKCTIDYSFNKYNVPFV